MARVSLPGKGNRAGCGGTALSGASWPQEHSWVAAPWIIYPLTVLAVGLVIDEAVMYVVHPLRERRSVLRSSDTDGIFTDRTARLHPLFKDGSQVCN